jgi:hypothetical protein
LKELMQTETVYNAEKAPTGGDWNFEIKEKS